MLHRGHPGVAVRGLMTVVITVTATLGSQEKAVTVTVDVTEAGKRAAAEERYRAIVEVHPEYASDLPGWLSRLQEAG